MVAKEIKKIRTYCAQCFSNCPVIAEVRDGHFVKVSADRDHPFFRPLCPKGHAGPELVAAKQRLLTPLVRTNPKGSEDAGWQPISWEKALEIITENMKDIRATFGAESFVFSQTNVSSPLWEISAFIRRLANLYGSPNHMTTTHICNWHRDNGSAFTFGKPGDSFSAGWPDFKNSRCALIWGHNPKNTFNAYGNQIQASGNTRIIVIDPRPTDIARRADIWLQVKPGTDGALALGMIHTMIMYELYDKDFVRQWTNAPLLVRSDTGNLLTAADTVPGEHNSDIFYILNTETGKPVDYTPGTDMGIRADLEGQAEITLADGSVVLCGTVFNCLKKNVEKYTPDYVEELTSVSGEDLLATVQMIVENSPASWYSFNGIEQNINATQTNRAICTFYALTGDYDKKGGNVVNSPIPPLNFPFGFEFITPSMVEKNLAFGIHPLGPAGTLMSLPPHVFCSAIEESVPYPVKGLITFGANTISANPNSLRIAEAIKKLDFYVHIDHAMNPTAELADIVLPSAVFWEIGRIGYPMAFEGNKWALQWREPVSEPLRESRDELWIICEIAKRLGFSDQFWSGNIDVAFEEMLRPMGYRLADLKNSKGPIFIQGLEDYQKYLQKGFDGVTGRIEIFSQVLKILDKRLFPNGKTHWTYSMIVGLTEVATPFC